MLLSFGRPMIFLTRPISAVLLGIALVALIAMFLPSVSRKRAKVFTE
jgi:TctA family transporter